MLCAVSVIRLQPPLGGFGELVNAIAAAFATSNVPVDWVGAHLSAMLKKRGPFPQGNDLSIAAGTVLGKASPWASNWCRCCCLPMT